MQDRVLPGRMLVASYADVARARLAADALAAAGIGASQVAVIGEDAAVAADAAELARQDRSMIWRIFWAGLLWGAAGAVAGGLLGLGLALLEFPTDNIPIQVAAWAMFVHIAATLWAAYAVIDDGTPTPKAGGRDGRAVVVVRSLEASRVAEVEGILRAHAPTGVEAHD